MFKNKSINEINFSKIIAIQFSILSPEEIINGSVAKITSRETKPVIGGIFDPRMGVLDRGMTCPTDGLDNIQTPGYFGHIQLARPVFYIQYLNIVINVLRCICFKCSKLKLSKEKHKHILNWTAEERWKYIFALSNKINRCGEDNENGCGCLQPFKIKKEGLATIIAEWKNTSSNKEDEIQNIVIKVTPEMFIKIFKRISDEDVSFMGFSPIWSRPDWMICQVLSVPPPAVRPSVKHDSQQKSEDDLTHILINIIKSNKTLQDKINNNAPANIIDDWTTVVQYYIATMVDNKIPGVAAVAQRSGRPLKSIKERLNGKSGRMRGNLMAKRVDYSARSVITADSNISIKELGIPMKIAKNITKPVIVNSYNKNYLTKLVQNGPDIYPGAKILERKNGESITLRYVDRNSIILEDGDKVHRHMMDGDPVIFNRQPTLHRMSMQCHIARVMEIGDTFRLNVAVTKPYNADFDGDEMNLHMPQDIESDAELLNLAAVPFNIISPANNSPIIGIFQDSMLGSYLFTRKHINFNKETAMNLLMSVNNVDTNIFKNKQQVSNFDLLTQILPPFSLKTKNKQFDDDEDKNKSNNIIEIINGNYIRGQLDKGILGGGSKGIIHRICNDFGNQASADFIDNLQRLITDYMTKTSFSVGISDLLSDNTIKDKIINVITDKKNRVKDIIDQTQIGIFENETGKTNQEEFETRVNNILNQATSEAGKIALTSLNKDNHFVIMVNAGSKGSDLNIAQMTACLGQQNVDGRRIPYGFEHRTLPHYTKYDDSPNARGFVENSYINGLTPNELFFHAMGGRVGLIDTAVKTSSTGYIQRRLIKSMEDLMVRYDGTVRSNKDYIIQFSYGDDGIDTTKVENQELRLVNMSIQEIYSHFNIPEDMKPKILNNIFIKEKLSAFKKELKDNVLIEKLKGYTDMMLKSRNEIVENVFKNKDDFIVRVPVAFSHIINNILGQQNINSNSLVDITFLEAFEIIENNYNKLEKIYYFPPRSLFKVLYYFYLSPKELLINKRFNKNSLILLLENINLFYKKSIVAPGEMVGMIAAQSIGEPTTQLCECYTEHIRCVKINKNTKNISMLSGEIGKMCDDIIEKLPEYTFNTGRPNSVETLLEPLEDEYYIIGVDKEEKTHWNKISHISRHPVNGELMKITTRSGRSVTTTPAHSHLVRRNQQVVPIVGYDMKVGMRIPVAKHIDNDFVNDTIKIGEETFKLDYLFGWFIGAYLAEGNLTRKGKTGNVLANGTIQITNIHPLYIENVKKFASLFGKECKIIERLNSIQGSIKLYPGKETTFYHRELAEFINTTCGNGSFVKRVPDFAFLAPNEFKGGLIQGYFDGDGNFMNDKNHHQIRVCSRSFQLIKDISLLLAYFDIFGSIHTKPKHKIDMHYLAISSRYSVLYKENINSLLHIEKLDNLVNYTLRDNIHNLSDDIDRIEGLGIIIAECGKKLKLPGQSRNYGRWIKKEMNGIPIGRRTLQKYIDLFENNEKSYLIQDELKILNQAVSSNVIWDEIVDINFYTPDQSEYVYDFTVPQNQTFMNDSGIIVHNTLNSVTFETPIMVRNTNGEIQKVQIGQFTEDNIKTSPKIEYMKDKDTTYAELKDYYEVPSCDEDGNVSWKKIEAVTRHPVVNEDGTNVMLKITTKEQREVIATKAKSFLKLTNGKLIATNGSELKVGDYLPVSKKQINFEEKYELDLKSILPPNEYIYTSEMEKAKSVMNETFWWKKHSNKTFILPYSRSDSVVSKITGKRKGRRNMEESFKPNCVYMKNNTMNVSCIPETIPLDYNFGYLVGAYAAEGCMTKHQISISNNDYNYFEPILKLCHKWNITTKKYKRENCQGNEGWTSQDLRIYNTMLCRLLEIIVGKLSHNKFISDKFIFSNKECLKGFLDGYIGGDGSIDIRSKTISISSVSKNMLIDTQQILNIFGIYSFITKPKKAETNNIGSKDIKQPYTICIVGNQIKSLANILNIKINYKQNALQDIINHTYMYEINRNNTIIPNEVDGKIIFEERTPDKYEDIIFDRIISIEEVSNTTNYAFDLTVEETRTFMLWNNLLVFDTFHSAGISSKSNVTRGVPRIEEILTVSAHPKNPSLTVFLKPQDETNKDIARNVMYMLEHTELQDLVKSIEICFDPDDLNTLIEEDKETITQYKEFENIFNDCIEQQNEIKNDNIEKSKWILRIELEPSIMLQKNITMDDIHFTLKNSYGQTIQCIFSDYNSDKLIFRIRMNNIIKQKTSTLSKKIKVNPLDQTDQIYFIKNFQEELLKNIVLRGVRGIDKVILRKLKDNKEETSGIFVKKEIWVLDTIGTNLLEVLGLNYINQNKTFSNDIVETFNVLGIEAARQVIYNELSEVLEFDGTYINYHHMALLVDRMTYASNIISVFRHGINNDDTGPIAKASFEETNGQFLRAARHAELDNMRGVSANVMVGSTGFYGTSSFDIVLDMNYMSKLEENSKISFESEEENIEKLFKLSQKDKEGYCSIQNIKIDNNIININTKNLGDMNDNYNPF
jgi:DNA-directed RNA polymerase beta' subunit